MKKVLFVVGSLRKESFNGQVALEVLNMIAQEAEVTYLDYADVPFVNQDIEFPEPEAVGRLRKAVSEADGVWVFTPEYNYSYPAHVKNLFDWLSRPLKAGDYDTPTAIRGKKVAIAGIGGRNQTKDCREKLTSLLEFIGADVLPLQVGLMVNGEAWADNVVVLTDDQKAELKSQAEAFLKFI